MSKKKPKDNADGSEPTYGPAAVGGKIPPRTISELLVMRAARSPDAVAIAASDRVPLTYRRLAVHVQDVVESLNSFGIGRRDRVAIVLPDGPEIATAFLATASGAIAAPLNPDLREREFEFFFSDFKPKAILAPSNASTAAVAAAQSAGIPVITLSPSLKREAGLFTLECAVPHALSSNDLCDPEDVALLLYTSGTTSRPKPVPLTHRNLLASARNIRTTLSLKSEDCCLNVMPLFHIHGLVGAVLSSIAAGSSIICTAGFDPERFFARLKEFCPTWYTAVPTIHQAILSCAPEDREMFRESSLRFIRSSSAGLPPAVMKNLEELFAVPVIEAYGMTEAAHQIASNPLPPGQRKPGSVGLAVGTEIAIVDEHGQHVSSGQIGEIVLRGPNLMEGYENAANSADDWVGDGWFRTGDLGYLDTDSYLFITGRLKEQINRGGEKISPYEVETILLEHPAIAEAVVFPFAHASLGEDIAAAVVLKPNCSISEGELQRYVAEKLADFKIPRRVVVVDEIPTGPTGKMQRAGLAEKLGLADTGTDKFRRKAELIAPRTPIEKTLATIWIEVLKIAQISVDDDFFVLGGDSIQAVRVISRIRDAMGVELSFMKFFGDRTLARMAASIETAVANVRSAAAPLPQVRRQNGNIPLSFAQERMWFIDQLEPGNPVYNRPATIRLTGPVSMPVLERCVNEMVRRHEILRTIFPSVDGRPVQEISPHQPLTLAVRDISGLPDSEKESEARRDATAEARLSFDLARGPLLRARILRLAREEHILLLSMHHIVFDGWSMEVVLRELSTLYNAFSRNRPSPLPELPIQYADFSVWQRRWLQGNDLGAQLSYWRQQLDGTLPVLGLPTDHPRPPVQTFRGARQSLMLPKELTEALKSLSQREHVTLFMTLLSAFEVLLHRYTGQDDIVLGTPVAGRHRLDFEGMIGLLVNTVVLRLDLSGKPSFRDLLRRVREVALEAYSHQDLPFEKLVEELRPERDLSRNPIFQVMFQLRNVPGDDSPSAGLKLEKIDFDYGISRLDLSLEVEDRPEGLFCEFEYSTDLFDSDTISRTLNHYQTLLHGIVADPGQRIERLPLLTESERHQLLEWDTITRDFPRDRCLHELFEAQVEQRPQNIAVTMPSTDSGSAREKQLTYHELNRRANQLARFLQKSGVGTETLVGVCTERSLNMIIGMLAVLKAGGAYVPLDSAYPKERLDFMLEDARINFVLTQEHLRDRLSLQKDRVICLDSDWETISRQEDKNIPNRTTPENLAYVIYTSGSTGRPKGVQIRHRSVCRLLESTRFFDFNEKDVWTVYHSFSFDFSVWEIWKALSHGSRLVIVPLQTAQSPADFYKLLRAERVTVLNQTPSALRILTELMSASPEKTRDLNLRLVISAGEAFSTDLACRLSKWNVSVWNTYGPTEATVLATLNARASRCEGETISIGRPFIDWQIYLLNQDSQAVPVGIVGEIHIGGVGLARGYLNRPDLTAEKFIPDPFSTHPGARLYRTGDLARYLPDGNIEFLGRIDHQVKIRGFRVELGEIETALKQHPTVREAVALARAQGSGGNQLVAYVVSREDQATIGELRAFLQAKLPDYMIPSAFVFLDALPLTPNGKLDRKALPEPDPGRPELETEFVAPRTPVEETLAGIWAEVLKLEKIGVHDNFFDLGGHSLLATQLMARIKTSFRTDIPLRTLFEKPTIEELAAVTAEANGKTDSVQAHTLGVLAELESISEEEAKETLDGESSAKK